MPAAIKRAGPSTADSDTPNTSVAKAAILVTVAYAAIAAVTTPSPIAAPVSNADIAGCLETSSVNLSVISAIPFLNCATVGFMSSPMAIARLLKLFCIRSVAYCVVFVIAE